jgi:His-Xaa-Ser system protein HxsD
VSAVGSGEPGLFITLSSAVYELEAVKRAAYRFSDRVVVHITPDGETISCKLVPLSAEVARQLDDVATQFRIEVLDHDLRLKTSRETEPLRNLVLSLAFSKTGLEG